MTDTAPNRLLGREFYTLMYISRVNATRSKSITLHASRRRLDLLPGRAPHKGIIIISHNVPTFAARLSANRLLPPGLEAGAEVGLGPGGEHDDVRLVDVGVREGEGEGRGAADHLTLVVVLGAVARALELVLSLVPGHDASEVGAHGVEAVVLDGAVILDDDVGGVTLRWSKGRGRLEGQRGCSRARKLFSTTGKP